VGKFFRKGADKKGGVGVLVLRKRGGAEKSGHKTSLHKKKKKKREDERQDKEGRRGKEQR